MPLFQISGPEKYFVFDISAGVSGGGLCVESNDVLSVATKDV